MPGTNVPIPLPLSIAPLLGTQTADAVAITGGTIQNVTITGGAWTPTSVTFADGSTWTSTGLSMAGSYSTSSTPFASLAGNWTFSSTANGIMAISLAPVLIPAGATAGNISGVRVNAHLGASAVNTSTLRGVNSSITLDAGYSGTLSNIETFLSNTPTFNGTQTFCATVYHFHGAAFTNGNGITSGTAANSGLVIDAPTAAAGAGGTVINAGAVLNVGSGSSTGTTNYGLKIAGNGGALSTNYGLYYDGTAPSLISGLLALSATNAITASVTQTQVGGTALTTALNRITTCANSGDAVTLAALTPGQSQIIYNDGANPAKVFPATGGNIDGAGANAAVTLTNAKRAIFTCFATNVIISAQLGVVSA